MGLTTFKSPQILEALQFQVTDLRPDAVLINIGNGVSIKVPLKLFLEGIAKRGNPSIKTL